MSRGTLRLALERVEEERGRQDEKWSPIESLVGISPEEWLVKIGEEYGECCRAAIEDDPNVLLDKLTDLAATAVSAIEAIGLHPRVVLKAEREAKG